MITLTTLTRAVVSCLNPAILYAKRQYCLKREESSNSVTLRKQGGVCP